jgi:nitrogen fixation NifU-like protein
MGTNKSQENLLKQSGYSEKAIHYYIDEVNVGVIENPDAYFAYTGPCGDTMEFFLEIESGTIKNIKFQAIGCAGSFSAGSAIAEMARGLSVAEASAISEGDIFKHLEEVPEPKVHCITLARRTFSKALEEYTMRDK